MIINEGPISNDAKTLIKSEMIRQIRQLGPTTPEAWEHAVFERLTGQSRDDVDWSLEDNQAGYYTWIKSFDQLIMELIEDGYVREVQGDKPGTRTLVPVEVDPAVDFPQLAYPRG